MRAGLDIFHNVTITLYRQLNEAFQGGLDHWGGPKWPDWDQQVAARHCRAGRPIDREPSPETAEVEIEKPVAWGGPIVQPFGHQVGEFSMRLLPTALTCPGWPIVLTSAPRWPLRSLDDAPKFFWGILTWFGIPSDRAILVTRPALVRTLAVMPQAEQLGGPGPSPEYLDQLDDLTARRLGPERRVPLMYVSRAAQPARFAGEAYLERALEAAGCRVIRPESLPLPEQLRAYASADRIIFAEGSAVYGTRLIGRNLGDVWILKRRPRESLFESACLEPRARHLTYVDAIRNLVTGLRQNLEPAMERGMTIIDLERLAAELTACMPDFRTRVDEADFRKAQEADLRHYFSQSFHKHWVRTPGSIDRLMTTLAESGFSHLVSETRRSLDDLRDSMTMEHRSDRAGRGKAPR